MRGIKSKIPSLEDILKNISRDPIKSTIFSTVVAALPSYLFIQKILFPIFYPKRFCELPNIKIAIMATSLFGIILPFSTKKKIIKMKDY